MSKNTAKILILVEGAKADVALMRKVLSLYGISENHQIVSYNTNIYDLYRKMFFEDDPDSLDLLQVLKEHEKDSAKKALFDYHYSDIILIFDLDPQDPKFSSDAILRMAEYFRESSDNGKLYLNYPMVEAFYHMKTIPDRDYDTYTVSLDELKVPGEYKKRVKRTCRIPYREIAQTKEKCDVVIAQNLEKARKITGAAGIALPTDTIAILTSQLSFLYEQSLLSVLCTCIFYIADYNPNLIDGMTCS